MWTLRKGERFRIVKWLINPDPDHYWQKEMCRNLISVKIIIVFLFCFGNLYSQSDISAIKTLKGTIHKYTISDNSDTLSSGEIIELRASNGLPLWFSREFYQVVCLTGLCRMVHYKIYWKGSGTYLGLEVYEKEPLTKSDHTEFKKEDYSKLDRILGDSISVFKKLKPEDLIIPSKDSIKNPVDGHSGATEPSISAYVVKDAVYTCYTLWHTVYGSTFQKLKSILDQRTNSAYLQLVFNQNDPDYVLWGINFVKNHKDYHTEFFQRISGFIKSENINISKAALKYFTPSILSDISVQKELASMEVSVERKFDIIWLLSTLPDVGNETILYLLGQFEGDQLSSTMLGYVYKMISTEKLKDARILVKLKTFADDDNMYVRNITKQVLSQVN